MAYFMYIHDFIQGATTLGKRSPERRGCSEIRPFNTMYDM